MVDLYYLPAPKGHKNSIAIGQTGLGGNFIPCIIGEGARPRKNLPAIINQ
jgi:hypothetical protein